MANTRTATATFRTKITTGSSEPVVDVTWDSSNMAADSFIDMCESVGIELGRREFKVLITLFMGGYNNQVFQLLSPDNNAVVSIERI